MGFQVGLPYNATPKYLTFDYPGMLIHCRISVVYGRVVEYGSDVDWI